MIELDITPQAIVNRISAAEQRLTDLETYAGGGASESKGAGQTDLAYLPAIGIRTPLTALASALYAPFQSGDEAPVIWAGGDSSPNSVTAIKGLSYSGIGLHGYATTGTGVRAETSLGYALIAMGGKVGIGTETPGNVLSVKALSSSDGIWLGGASGGIRAFLGLDSDVGTLQLRDTGAGLGVYLSAAGDSYFVGGDVGIGASAPQAKLDVYDAVAPVIQSRTGASGGGTLIQSILDADTSYGRGVFAHNAWWDTSTNLWNVDGIGANDCQAILIPNNAGFQFIIHASSGVSPRTFTHADFIAGAKVTITGGGGVGIGTTTPDRKMEILDSSAAQLRLTHTDAVDYADFSVDSNGDLTITPSGGSLGVGTLSTHYAISGQLSTGGVNGVATSASAAGIRGTNDNADGYGGYLASNGSNGVGLYAQIGAGGGAFSTAIYVVNAGTGTSIYINSGNVGLGSHKSIDLGAALAAFDDIYADDFHNVADFLYLDGLDDLEIIRSIKPSGEIDERTGLPLIDDDTLPEILLSRDKETGRVLRDPDGNPYLSTRVVLSLLLGAIRALDRAV